MSELSAEGVRKALKMTLRSNNTDSFFMNSGRELPCQLESRTGTALTSHWRREGRVVRRAAEELERRAAGGKRCSSSGRSCAIGST